MHALGDPNDDIHNFRARKESQAAGRDRAVQEQLLDAIDELSATYQGDRRWRIEHAQIVDPVDLPRFRAHGTIASMQPVHQTSDRLMAEARMGIDRLQGAYAWRSMLDNGVPLAFGSDFPVEHPNPFHGLAAAISRQDAQGQPPGGWLPSQRRPPPIPSITPMRSAASA